jgi:hypothetical protein
MRCLVFDLDKSPSIPGEFFCLAPVPTWAVHDRFHERGLEWTIILADRRGVGGKLRGFPRNRSPAPEIPRFPIWKRGNTSNQFNRRSGYGQGETRGFALRTTDVRCRTKR